MLANGKIKPDESLTLLNALGDSVSEALDLDEENPALPFQEEIEGEEIDDFPAPPSFPGSINPAHNIHPVYTPLPAPHPTPLPAPISFFQFIPPLLPSASGLANAACDIRIRRLLRQ